MNQKTFFWDGVRNPKGENLTLEEQCDFCENLIHEIEISYEFLKLNLKTQMYHDIVNDVSTRGSHSKMVSIIAKALATEKARLDKKSELECKISGLLAQAIGYMHDLGHTPFGHEGERALNYEMDRFDATIDYKAGRENLFGKEYLKEIKETEKESMCFEHNEESAIIATRLMNEFSERYGYILSDDAMQYIKTGILAHSTSRFKSEPKGIEQMAVRLADKIAYISQDLLDLIKQNVISINDLTPDEQALLGLNEKQLTDKEREEYDLLTSEQDKEKYIETVENNKKKLKKALRNLDEKPIEYKMDLFRTLDSNVENMQAEIAKKCFVMKNGEKQLDGRKSIVDFYENFVDKGETPKNREVTSIKTKGIDLFIKLRNAQNIPMENPIRKKEVEKAATRYSKFLQEKHGIDPMIATMWVTKSKYQDSFIKEKLARVSYDEEGEIKIEKLSDINDEKNNEWKIKTIFQFFYTNIQYIPQNRLKKEQYINDQQVVAEFIASFTNESLNNLYDRLVKEHMIVSRENAIEELQSCLPNQNIESIVNNDIKSKDYCIPANDVLEYFYETVLNKTIVFEKNNIDDRVIPDVRHKIAIRDTVNLSKTISEKSELLKRIIERTKIHVTVGNIKKLLDEVLKEQDEHIKEHIDEIEK